MTPVDLLIATGEMLHGKHFTNKLADDLGIDDTTVRYWINGKRPLAPEHPIIDRLADLVDLKIADLINLKQKFLNPDGESVITFRSRKNSPQL
jgi:plasmid maintenance system antidote protein VapI